MTKAQNNALNKINALLKECPEDSPCIPPETMREIDKIFDSLSTKESIELRAFMLTLMEAIMRAKMALNN